ncbi:MAG TPA: hypothetical protein VEU76_09900, partial [Candidatus Udaeobacter sp.]|nr:hypothetical protein [Candidatus Udaeobacter sp.]
ATPSASAAAQSSPTPTINPVTGAYGVLVTPVTGSGTYTVTLVGVDGKIVASAQASSPPSASCANSAAALVPLPVSTSNSRAYFMDGTGAVHWIDPTGAKSPAAVVTLPAPTSSRRSLFAVSPDDAQMAVVVIDFTSSGATTNLYRYDLNAGGTQSLIFTQTGAYTLWPVGWHGPNNLVLGKIAACTQGGGPFTGTPTELHVVDPATANRRFTIGSSTCPPVNRPSPAGVICENPPNATVLNWTNTTLRTLPIQGPVGAYLSPSGANVAFVDNTGTIFTNGGSAMAGVFTCAWIDDTHVLAGGDPQNQARVGNLSNGSVVPVAAQGDCGGRIPGGL